MGHSHHYGYRGFSTISSRSLPLPQLTRNHLSHERPKSRRVSREKKIIFIPTVVTRFARVCTRTHTVTHTALASKAEESEKKIRLSNKFDSIWSFSRFSTPNFIHQAFTKLTQLTFIRMFRFDLVVRRTTYIWLNVVWWPPSNAKQRKISDSLNLIIIFFVALVRAHNGHRFTRGVHYFFVRAALSSSIRLDSHFTLAGALLVRTHTNTSVRKIRLSRIHRRASASLLLAQRKATNKRKLFVISCENMKRMLRDIFVCECE